MMQRFDSFDEYAKRVSPTCLIHLERNRYSVPASFANRPVSLRVYPDKLVVAAEGHVVCEQPRIIDRAQNGPGRTVYDWRHYLAVIQRKPGAQRNGAPFAELPEAFKKLQSQLLKRPGGDRSRTVYDWRHYLAVIQRKPGAQRNGAPFAELPEAFKKLQSQLLKRPGGD